MEDYSLSDKEKCGIYTYRLIEEKLTDEEIGEYDTYGVGVYEGERRVYFISDISTVIEEAELFILRCEREQPELVHLHDIAEDFIAEIYSD